MHVPSEQAKPDLRVRRLRKVVVVLVVMLALGTSLLWWQREALWMGWWDWRATHQLSALELGHLESCDPRWGTVRRMLDQDLDAGCDVLKLSREMAGHLHENPRRVRWVRRRLQHDSERTQARALLALVAAQQELPLDVSERVAQLLQVPAHRTVLLDALEREELEPVARHPSMEAQLLLRGIEADVVSDEVLVGELLMAAGWPLAPHVVRDEVRALVDERSEVMAHDLSDQHALRQRGRGFGVLPERLVSEVSTLLDACEELDSPSCDLARAQLLAASSELGDTFVRTGQLFEPAEGLDWVRALWDVDPTVARASGQVGVDWLGRRATWVALGPTPQARQQRLHRLVLADEHHYTGALAEQGMVGDPVYAVQYGAGASWASALAAVALGQAAGVEVRVAAHADGAVIAIGELEAVRVGPCGERVPAPLESPLLTADQVLARTAAERAEGHARGSRPGAAAALAALAHRLDPHVAARVGQVERVELLAGMSMLPTTSSPPPSACVP